MIDDKILNAYEYFHASSAFSAYLIDDEFDRIDSSYLDQYDREVYVKLLVTHSALLLALFKEDIITKDDEKNITLNIYEKAFDILMSNLCLEDGNKYKIGDMSFDSKKEVFDLLRNKLLHGDYAIDLEGYKVVLNNKGITGTIDILDLVETCKSLCTSGECKLDGENTRIMTVCKRQTIDHGPSIFNSSTLKKFMKDVYIITFTDKPMEGYKRDARYHNTLEMYYDIIGEAQSYYDKYSIRNALEIMNRIYLPYLRDAHIDISYEVNAVTELEDYSKVKSFYLSNREFLDSLTDVEKRFYMQLSVNNLISFKHLDYIVIASALLNNINMLSAYVSDVPFSEIKYIHQASNTFVDDMSIAAVFAQFYACYHYELDEIYSNGVGTSLKDVASNKYLDFSLLDLNGFNDSEMTIDNGFNDFANQLERMENLLEKARLKKDGAEIAYRKYMSNAKVKREEVEQRLLNNIEMFINEYNELLELYEKAKEFMENRYDAYVRNYNIISHIRNAFAHGNVKLMNHTNGDTLNDRVIVIEDNYEGACTYKLILTYKEFSKLFSNYNSEILYSFIWGKAKEAVRNKKLVLRPE